jgi:hypothetical protein
MRAQEWLRDEMAAVEAIDASTEERLGSGWRTRRAQGLLAETMTRFTPLAAKLRVTPGDIATAALEAWIGAGFQIPETHDAWAWTGAAVKTILSNEQQAERFLTTAGSQNLRVTADESIPTRFDPTDREQLEIPETRETATTYEPALALAAQYLVDAGVESTAAWKLIDALSTVVLGDDFERRDGRPSGVAGRKSAVTSLQRERGRVADDVDVDSDLVGRVTKLVFGSRERGGLLELRADGAPISDLRDYATAFAAKN